MNACRFPRHHAVGAGALTGLSCGPASGVHAASWRALFGVSSQHETVFASTVAVRPLSARAKCLSGVWLPRATGDVGGGRVGPVS